MTHNYEIKVRGFHCDLYGHVNNARYLEYLEEARWDYVDSVPEMAALGQRGLGFVIAAINIEYKRPVGLGAIVAVQSQMMKVEGKRAVMQQEIVNQATNKTVALAQVTFAVIDLKTGRSVALDGEVGSWFLPGVTDEAPA